MKKYVEQSFSCLHHVIILFSKQHADPAAEMSDLSLFEPVLSQEAPQTLQVCMNLCCSLHFCVKKIIIRLSQSRKDVKAFKIIGKLSGWNLACLEKAIKGKDPTIIQRKLQQSNNLLWVNIWRQWNGKTKLFSKDETSVRNSVREEQPSAA